MTPDDNAHTIPDVRFAPLRSPDRLPACVECGHGLLVTERILRREVNRRILLDSLKRAER